jgi:hypothetical protein
MQTQKSESCVSIERTRLAIHNGLLTAVTVCLSEREHSPRRLHRPIKIGIIPN